MKNKTILITGSSGLIGSHLTDFLLRQRARVIAAFHNSPPTGIGTQWKERVEFWRWDLSRHPGRKLEKIHWVFHLGAITDIPFCQAHPEQAYQVNSEGVRRVLQLSEDSHAERLVYVSTLGVYGNPVYLPMDEEHPKQPLDVYCQSKLQGEQLVLDFCSRNGMTASVARLFNTYGPGQNRNMVLPTLIHQALAQNTISLNNLDSTRDFIFVEDVVEGLVKIALKSPGGVFNLGTGKETSIRTLVDLISNLLNKKIALSLNHGNPPKVLRSQANIKKAHRVLGWTPKISLREGLSRTIDHFKKNHFQTGERLERLFQ